MPDKNGKATENEIRKAIKDYLEWNKWFVIVMYQSVLSLKGIADLYCIKEGISLWLEIKKPKGKQSQKQIDFEADIKAKGGYYYVVRSVDDTIEILKEI